MRKINKKDSQELLGWFVILCLGAIVVYLLPYLIFGILALWLICLVVEDDDKDDKDDKDNSNSHRDKTK